MSILIFYLLTLKYYTKGFKTLDVNQVFAHNQSLPDILRELAGAIIPNTGQRDNMGDTAA